MEALSTAAALATAVLGRVAKSHQATTNRTRHTSSHDHARMATGMSDPNVKIVPTET